MIGSIFTWYETLFLYAILLSPVIGVLLAVSIIVAFARRRRVREQQAEASNRQRG